jgi:hypothetical protein
MGVRCSPPETTVHYKTLNCLSNAFLTILVVPSTISGHPHEKAYSGSGNGGVFLSARSTEMEKLAEAAKPLYDSLDDAQKRRFRPLLHMAIGKHWRHGHEGFRHG